ncbi:MAG TPA: hypothetical protein VGB45_07705 [Abditibacterium sp.]|jgi:hypothetical protein
MKVLNPDFSTALDHVFLPFERVDNEKREITTTLFTTARVRGDKWNLKYGTLKRAADRYMKMPCIREMHQARAAGKATSLHFDDASQTATMTLRVVDDAAWEKVKEGVYRGVSIGGVPIITRGQDIEDFDWIETSLVDRPKDPGALFTVARTEDVLAAMNTIELPEGASDEDLAVARGEVEEQLERMESDMEYGGLLIPGADDLARFDHLQPRDENGMWTIVAGHRISVSGAAVDHNTIHEAKKRFGLSDETTGALLAAHKAGKISNDHHLFRTLSHAEALASNTGGHLGDVTTSHIETALAHHASGGSHEERWHSAAHGMAPKLAPGITVGHALGAHELKSGDVVHFPSHEGKPVVAGVVHKVHAKSIDIGSTVGAAQVGMRVKKEDLKRPGFVKRSKSGSASMHHIEVARGTEVEFFDEGLQTDLQGHAEAIHAILERVEAGDHDEAISQVAERLGALMRGEASSALESFDVELLERAEGRSGYKTQPRDDVGRWTDGAGKLSVSHVHDVMKHEGIHEDHHHADVKRKIESGELKTRADVLKHIDALHESRKTGDKKKETEAKTTESTTASKPEKTSKSGTKRPAWHETLRSIAKSTVHKFMNGYRKGKKAVGRAEGDAASEDHIPHLVDKFFDQVDDADDDTLARGLRAALAVLSGETPGESTVERLITSADAPARENLEGPEIHGGRKALDALRELLMESDWDGDRESLRRALHSVLDEIGRGEGDVSRAATLLLDDGARHLDVQRMEVLESQVSRLEGENSEARETAQAHLQRAELAEGNLSRLETENKTLDSENQKLRDMPDHSEAIQFGTVPLVRDFAANQVLSPSNSTHVRRGELESEFKQIQLDMQKEPNPAKREAGATRLIVVQQQLEQLRRLA